MPLGYPVWLDEHSIPRLDYSSQRVPTRSAQSSLVQFEESERVAHRLIDRIAGIHLTRPWVSLKFWKHARWMERRWGGVARYFGSADCDSPRIQHPYVLRRPSAVGWFGP